MNRAIEARLKRLEERIPPEKPPRRFRLVAARTPEEGAANIAALLAAGDASPGDQFVRLVPLKPGPIA